MVSQVFLHALDIVSGLQSCYGIAVPEIMETYLWQANSLYYFFEFKVDSLGRQVVSQFISKYQVLPFQRSAFSQSDPPFNLFSD